MEEFANGTLIDVTPAGVLGLSYEQVTSCILGDITYVNRPADRPIYREDPSDITFTVVPGWVATDRAFSMRAYKDFLVALNVTKTGVEYPGMIKWSDAAQVGAPPTNWDVASPASLAGELILNDLKGVLLDGAPLADSFIIYGDNQTFRMDFVGEPFIFRTSLLFDDSGAIAPNCSVNHDGRHYVFGKDDIFVHDGMQKQTIASGKIKDFLFSDIDYVNRGKCFAYHDKINDEIGFCYVSVSDDAPWTSDVTLGCNRAAVYNYRYDTWTFVDLPGAIAWNTTAQAPDLVWEASEGIWADSTSSWRALAGRPSRTVVLASVGNGTVVAQAYHLDGLAEGRLSNTLATDILWTAYASALYKDMDELGAELYGRKLLRRLVMQVSTSDPADTLLFRFGKSRNASRAVTWDEYITITPWESSKLDCRVNGKYLHFEVIFPIGVQAIFNGYDADINLIAGR
jgi:hypothetical protein